MSVDRVRPPTVKAHRSSAWILEAPGRGARRRRFGRREELRRGQLLLGSLIWPNRNAKIKHQKARMWNLCEAGGLSVDEGRAVPDVSRLLSRIWSWEPACIISDPYRSAELAQAVAGRCRIIESVREAEASPHPTFKASDPFYWILRPGQQNQAALYWGCMGSNESCNQQ